MKKKIFTAIAIIIVITVGIVNSIKLFRERKPNTSINVTGTKALLFITQLKDILKMLLKPLPKI